jgi:isoleucyl-tRNA synthetase
MKRVKDIFNVWFDSGIAPWASFGYPQKNRELFEELFPVSVVNESQDQVRGWFDSLMFCSMATFGKSPYERVAMMGWVVDEKGEKMSKSVGNVVPAKQGIEKLGADVVRLYYCWEISPWDVQKFSFTGAEEVRKALNIFWNSFTFLKTYGGTGSDENFGKKAFSLRAKEDKWIYSRLNSVAKRVSAHLDEFEFHLAGRTLLDFVLNDYSRWFVKLSRDRVSSEGGEDSQDCLSLMRYSLVQTAKLFAPITPFISEYIYQKLSAGSGMESVHYEEFPVADEGAIDSELEEEMALAMRVTEAANSARQAKKVKLRWPVAEVVVSGEGKCQETVSDLQGVLRKSCNALEVRFEKEFNGGEEFACGFFEGGKAFVSLKRDESLWNQSLFKELVRAVQESRKTNGLKVQQRVSLTAWTDNKAFLKYLKENSPELAKEVGANKITVQDSESDLTGEKKAEVQVEETRILAKYVLTGA